MLRKRSLTGGAQIQVVKKALHLSVLPSSVVCRYVEQEKVIGFCKSSIHQQVPGSMPTCLLYISYKLVALLRRLSEKSIIFDYMGALVSQHCFFQGAARLEVQRIVGRYCKILV